MSIDSGTAEPVVVLASEPDLDVAKLIARGMTGLGLPTVVGSPAESPPDRAIVIVSDNAVESSSWHDEVERCTDARLVPVRIGEVDAAAVPEVVRTPNWILWDVTDASSAKAAIFAALHSDMTRYVQNRTLNARANAWATRGRPDHLLIDSLKAAKQAAQHVIDAEHDPLAKPTDTVREFVAVSELSAAKSTRTRTRRWLIRSAAVIGTVVVVAGVIAVIRAGVKTNYLQFSGTSMPWMLEERPDRTAMLSAALLLQGSDPLKPIARETALDALAQPWSRGIIGANHTSPIIGAAVDHDGRRTLSLDSEGTVTMWDNTSLSVQWRRTVDPNASSGAVDAAPDMTRIAVSTDKTLHRITSEPWRDDQIALPANAHTLVMASTPGIVVAQIGEGDLVTVPFDGGEVAARQVYDSVLDLRRTSDGHVRALVRTKDQLSIVDPTTGEMITRTTLPTHQFEYGAVSPDSEGAFVTGADRQLYHAADGMAFRPTGQAVPDNLGVMKALPDGRIAFGGPEFGVRVFDTRVGQLVGEICRSTMSVVELQVASDGDLVACVDYSTLDLWPTRELSPLVSEPAEIVASSTTPSMSDGGLSASADSSGNATITEVVGTQRQTWQVQPVGSGVTAVSVRAELRSVVVATATGSVVQLALTGNRAVALRRWVTPDRSGVTRLGWHPDGLRLQVFTSTGLVWSLSACSGCENDDVLVDRVRDRLWGCYTENQVEYLDDKSRDRLHIRTCSRSPQI